MDESARRPGGGVLRDADSAAAFAGASLRQRSTSPSTDEENGRVDEDGREGRPPSRSGRRANERRFRGKASRLIALVWSTAAAAACVVFVFGPDLAPFRSDNLGDFVFGPSADDAAASRTSPFRRTRADAGVEAPASASASAPPSPEDKDRQPSNGLGDFDFQLSDVPLNATSRPTDAPTNEPTTPPADFPPLEKKLYHAIVIGAGWSGIHAAKLLRKYKANVLVLEATDYLGGRSKTAYSDAVPGIPTDLGSEWLYDGTHLFEHLKNESLIDIPLKGPKDTNPLCAAEYYYAGGRDAGGNLTAARRWDAGDKWRAQRLWSKFVDFKEKLVEHGGDVSYGDAMEQFLVKEGINENESRQYLNMIMEVGEAENTGKLLRIPSVPLSLKALHLTSFVRSWSRSTLAPFSPCSHTTGEKTRLSVAENSYWWAQRCGTNTHYMSIPGVGYGSVAKSVASKLDADIRTNSTVTGVHEVDNGVVVTYEQNGELRAVGASTVLVTVSLGVLKAGTIDFSPPLPHWKRNAIDNMGFGTLNKVILYWKHERDVVWPEDSYWVELITPEDDTSGKWTNFFNPTKLKGVPCLEGWIGGEEATTAEELTEEEILKDVMASLRSMFPTIRDPDEYFVTRWGRDERFRGSYSYAVAGRNHTQDRADLQKRVGRVWFAGEAAASSWSGTTGGAWITGHQAARGMLYRLSQGKYLD
ncbi:hypothetical protein ACHAWF_005382 [Thalassiosira exigua]